MSPFRQNTTVSSRVGQELGFGRVGAGPTVSFYEHSSGAGADTMWVSDPGGSMKKK